MINKKVFILCCLVYIIFSTPLYSQCTSDSDCPDGYRCTGADSIIVNCPKDKICSGCQRMESAYKPASTKKSSCPTYSNLDDCLSKCTSASNPCAAYVGSCDYYCKSNYAQTADFQTPSTDSSESNLEFDDLCLQECADKTTACLQPCGDPPSDECQRRCSKIATDCALQCSDLPSDSNNNCDVDCSLRFCRSGVLYYDGFCQQGKCKYHTFECGHGCDKDNKNCLIIEANTNAPTIEIYLSTFDIVLNSDSEVDFSAKLIYQNGTPAVGATVYVTLDDSQSTGLLGKWDSKDVRMKTDNNGMAKGTFSFPNINTIQRIHWDLYPYDLDMTVRAYLKNTYHDWEVVKEEKLTLQSPVPRIKQIKVMPDRVETLKLYDVEVEIEDADSQGGFTYKIETYGGRWFPHQNRVNECSGSNCTIETDLTLQNWEWLSPARGLSEDEISMARQIFGDDLGKLTSESILANREGLAINLLFTGGQTYAEKNWHKLPSTLSRNTVYGYHFTKGFYNIADNSKNIARGIHDISRSSGWKETAWRSADLTIEGMRTAIGVLTLSGGAIPIIGQWSSAAQDVVDFAACTLQSGLKLGALRERVLSSQELEADMAFYVEVIDSDGNQAQEFYSFKMHYLGFDDDV
jgi:hypothetical protein